MSEETKHDRRRFLRNAAMTIAAAEFGMVGLLTRDPTQRPQG